MKKVTWTLAKFRCREGALQSWPKADRQAYGAAIEAAVLKSQAAALRRAVSLPVPACASSSWANAPGEVGDVVRRQQAAALVAYPAKARAARTPYEWEIMYAAAMPAAAMPAGFIPSWKQPKVS